MKKKSPRESKKVREFNQGVMEATGRPDLPPSTDPFHHLRSMTKPHRRGKQDADS